MSVVRNKVISLGLARAQLPGDVIAAMPTAVALTTAGNGSITAAMVAAGFIRRSGPSGAFTDTLPTSEQIASLLRGFGLTSEWVSGLGIPLRIYNSVAQALTLAVPSNEGISLSTSVFGTSTAVAASKWRDYFIELASAPVPSLIVTGATTNGSKKLLLDSEAAAGAVVPGMSVYGTGVGASAKVTHVIYGTSGIKEVWVDTNSTADGAAIVLSFKPTVVVHSLAAGDI